MTLDFKNRLEDLYSRYNRREFVHPDPLEFLYGYDEAGDREIAGIIASALAFGRVSQILRSVSTVLSRMGRPLEFVFNTSGRRMEGLFSDFRHRFTTGLDLTGLLIGLRGVIEKYGTLEGCFAAGCGAGDETVLPALAEFAREVRRMSGRELKFLLPSPESGSACKRLNLFLRWMVRRDDVDPGGWDRVSPSRLIIPLDTHMFRLGTALGFTTRRQADLKAAIEITEGFRGVEPEDPVKYDFALTRLGIRDDTDMDRFITSCGRVLV